MSDLLLLFGLGFMCFFVVTAVIIIFVIARSVNGARRRGARRPGPGVAGSYAADGSFTPGCSSTSSCSSSSCSSSSSCGGGGGGGGGCGSSG